MIILKTIEEYKKHIDLNKGIGFVPTMGALHLGHAKLIEESVRDSDLTVVSIFVNPTQFNDPKDFESYPDTWGADVELCESKGVDIIFAPKAESMYFPDESIEISENDVSKKFEGEYRPGHFNGVLLVLLKLLNIIKPQFIYMGEKDYQQALLTEKMCRDFFLNTKVKVVDTVRDNMGLPFSSRNLKLSDEGLEKARIIAEKFHASTDKEEFLEDLDINLDYIGKLKRKVLMAHRVEGVRILDNKDL